MNVKSDVVNLGIIDENPSTTAGAIAIMQHLHRYVPCTGEDMYIAIPAHGDQLSVERSTNAKRV